MKYILVLASVFAILITAKPSLSQTRDTVVVQTLTYDSIGRAGVFHFPDTGTYERVLLDYSMRCKHALVTTQHAPNDVGCGEWDYNCETYVWDSTRTDSLKNKWPSALISNYPTYTKFPWTTNPIYTVTRRDLKNVSYSPYPSFNVVQTTGGPTQVIFNKPYGRMLMTYTGSELTSFGLKAGKIYGLRLNVQQGSATIGDLRVRMRSGKSLVMGEMLSRDDTLAEVYRNSCSLLTGTDSLLFYTPFTWDGTSDIAIEVSYTGLAGSITMFGGPTFGLLSSATNEYAMSFASSELVPLPKSALDSLQNAITIAFWAYGDTLHLPGTGTVLCEGLDDQNHRQVNIHLPWSDNTVYWDCGSDAAGNFDRIQKSAPNSAAAGKWNHWVFTKDAVSGKMAIYLNGSLWMNDTGKHRQIRPTRMMLGGAISSLTGYFGELREFAMFNYVLDSNQIKRLMQFDSIPPSSGLVSYYKFDEGSGSKLYNSAGGKAASTLIGVPVWRHMRGQDLPNQFQSVGRPNLSFLQLTTTPAPTISDRYTYDTLPEHAHFVIEYNIGHNYAFHANDSGHAIDTIFGRYLATREYNRDERGIKYDSTSIAAMDTVSPNYLYYFTRGPQKFELMSFVTPYGIGLDLGKTGQMWEFDVTDYLPILKGWKRLSMERGSGQEEFDLRFLFIKGTPARNVLNMQQVWPMTEENYQTIMANDRYEPRKVYLDPAAKAFKVRSYITGHGAEVNNTGGEFHPQTHYISIDSLKYERLVWKICSADPLYPQGGTWTLNRAGWCPGMATDLAEYEVTGKVKPGDSVLMDYGVEGGAGDSRYDPSTQLVTYSAPNFTLNAGIVDIERPSNRIAFGRINPACDLPIIVIRNNGSQPLTSLNFEYYVDGGPHKTYSWSGNLKFMDTQAVVLPVDSLGFWTSAQTGLFHVNISQPNGGTDQYDADNHYSSVYTQPPAYTGIVVLNLYTNNDPQDNYYEIRNLKGDTVFQNGGFDPTTSYYDSLMLPVGCYTMVFHDDGEDGLSYWANPSQGTGYLRFRQTSKTGKILKTFQPDFGKIINYDFQITQSPLGVTEPNVPYRRISIYPNPAQSYLRVQMAGYPGEMIAVEILDVSGRSIEREQRMTDADGNFGTTLDLKQLARGNYFVKITDSKGSMTRPFVVQ